MGELSDKNDTTDINPEEDNDEVTPEQQEPMGTGTQPTETGGNLQEESELHLSSLEKKLADAIDTISVFAGALKEARMGKTEKDTIIEELTKNLNKANKSIGTFLTNAKDAKALEGQIQSLGEQLDSLRTQTEQIPALTQRAETAETEKGQSDVQLSLARTAAETARGALSSFADGIEDMIANSKKRLAEADALRLKTAREDAQKGKTGASALARLRARKNLKKE